MRALVTGATGFVGPHLCAHLRDSGDAVLVAGDEHDNFDVTDPESVARALALTKPDVVYHLAARADVAASWREPTETMRVNVLGTQHVLDAAREHGVRRVLVVGSAEEYGRIEPADLPVSEDAPLRPISPYGTSKVAASYIALQAWLGSELETVRVRPFNHTGPGQSPAFFFPALARRIAEAEAFDNDTITAGNLDAVRDTSDVRDVVRAYRLLMQHATPGEVYNVCSGTGVAIGDMAQRLLARARRPLRIETDAALLRPAEIPTLIGDPTKLRAATGYAPRYSLDQTVEAVLEAARAHVSGRL